MTPTQRFDLTLADGVLLIHAAYIAFVVVGLVLVWIGRFCGWSFVRNIWFRAAHIAAMGVVVAESLCGVECPLTKWEDELRLAAGGEKYYAGSFIQEWVQRLIFFNVDERIFTVVYIIFFAMLILSFWLVPPHWPRRRRVH